MLPIIGALIPILDKVLDKVIPNVAEREKVKMELQLKLAEQEGKLMEALVQSDVAQAEINKIEAESASPFKSGWRPALSWCCAVGFAWNIFLPVVAWGLKLFNVAVPDVPNIGGDMLISMTFGILGLAGYRTYEKKNGITK